MTRPRKEALPYVLFQVKGTPYAVSAEHVREVLSLPRVIELPLSGPAVRGAISLRGQVIQLIDLRQKLGFPSLKSEASSLIGLLREREQDHRNWLTELEACVREGRPFGMARDPHRCKFGLWYDQFRTKDQLLRMTLPSMDAPHRAIHATADEALRLAEAGRSDTALRLIEERRKLELSSLIRLFEESRRVLEEGHREVVLVLSFGGHPLAFTADSVDGTEPIPEGAMEPLDGLCPGARQPQPGTCRVATRAKTAEPVAILTREFFVADGIGSRPSGRQADLTPR